MSGEPLETENVGREERQRGEDEPRRIDIANATINWIVSHLRTRPRQCPPERRDIMRDVD